MPFINNLLSNRMRLWIAVDSSDSIDINQNRTMGMMFVLPNCSYIRYIIVAWVAGDIGVVSPAERRVGAWRSCGSLHSFEFTRKCKRSLHTCLIMAYPFFAPRSRFWDKTLEIRLRRKNGGEKLLVQEVQNRSICFSEMVFYSFELIAPIQLWVQDALYVFSFQVSL